MSNADEWIMKVAAELKQILKRAIEIGGDQTNNERLVAMRKLDDILNITNTTLTENMITAEEFIDKTISGYDTRA